MTAFLALFQDWWDYAIALLLLTGPVSLVWVWRTRATYTTHTQLIDAYNRGKQERADIVARIKALEPKPDTQTYSFETLPTTSGGYLSTFTPKSRKSKPAKKTRTRKPK